MIQNAFVNCSSSLKLYVILYVILRFFRKIFLPLIVARSTESKIKLVPISPLIVPFFGVNVAFPRNRDSSTHYLYTSITPHPPPPPPPAPHLVREYVRTRGSI